MCEQRKIETSEGGDASRGSTNWDVAAELRPLEARLATLSPRSDRLDRDRLMFLAGQAALVDAKFEGNRVFGLRLESRLWPAAFAAMSAVAAALLVMLVVTDERAVTTGPAIGVSGRSDRAPLAIEHSFASPVLSTLDAHAADIDRLLARDDSRSDTASSASDPIEFQTRPILTPAGWGQVLNEAEHLPSSPPDASTIRHLRGVNS